MVQIERILEKDLKRDLQKKVVILAGPRQCGKTTLAKKMSKSSDYLNYDNLDDRSLILNRTWDRKKETIIFDELHKMPKWKSWIKGIYDKEGVNPQILITGSARLDAFKKTGDSLAGRHFYYRLHPFDIKELVSSRYNKSPQEILNKLMNFSGYPEPFLTEDAGEYRRWRSGHLDQILRQDLNDHQTLRDAQSIQILIELLRHKVASGVSVNALATDLGKDPKTVLKWLNILEDLFVIFKLTPYSKNISRSLKKEPKYYFYDTAFVEGDEGVKLENAVACALLKEVHYLSDAKGIFCKLHYLKVKGGREIDFVIIPENKNLRASLIETKWAESDASANFKLFQNQFKNPNLIQLVGTLKRNQTTSTGVEVTNAANWLADFNLVRE